MKKYLLTSFILFCLCCLSYAQHLNYGEFDQYNVKTMSYIDFDSYTASDGTEFKVGEKVQIGNPVGNASKFTHILIYTSPLATPTNLPSGSCNNQSFEITRITLNGNNKRGVYYVGLWTYTNTSIGKFIIDVEPSLQSGEIVGSGMTSDKALEELMKWKQKLDLELITVDEYNAKKTELSKYIK